VTEPLAAEPPTRLVQGCRDTDDCCPGAPEACRLDAARAEETAIRLYGVATAGSPSDRRAGFAGWSPSSSTERSPEE
jgi:hypothetical protein